jgi:hypothetical protein
MKQSSFKSLALALAASTIALMASTSDALAGPIWVFSTSVGTQPSNVGIITLTQNGANSVDVSVDLLNSSYGFLNTGGKHTPFAFNLAGSESGLSISFADPLSGIAPKGTFSLNTAGGENTPYGIYGVAIDYSGGNGSSNAYYGDLDFTLTRTGGLSTDDFIKNADGYFFSADITNGSNTGAQAWAEGIDPPAKVPEPLTLSLFAAGLAGMAGLRRRKSSSGAAAA